MFNQTVQPTKRTGQRQRKAMRLTRPAWPQCLIENQCNQLAVSLTEKPPPLD